MLPRSLFPLSSHTVVGVLAAADVCSLRCDVQHSEQVISAMSTVRRCRACIVLLARWRAVCMCIERCAVCAAASPTRAMSVTDTEGSWTSST
jgi:hypothetical protein